MKISLGVRGRCGKTSSETRREESMRESYEKRQWELELEIMKQQAELLKAQARLHNAQAETLEMANRQAKRTRVR